MFGLRRHRLFLIVAALAAATVYHLASGRHWDVTDSLDPTRAKTVPDLEVPFHVPPPSKEDPDLKSESRPDLRPEEDKSKPKQTLPPITRSTPSLSPPSSSSSPVAASSTLAETAKDSNVVSGSELLAKPLPAEEEFGEIGQGRQEIDLKADDTRRAYWKKQKSRFPISEERLIPLPKSKSKQLPRIQANFKAESASAKKDRLAKLATIRETFKQSWNGYVKHAMGHDEIKPVTKGYTDPFNGWGATLVDTLDTLLVMGLEEEFEEALQAVARIDFRTSGRKNIPLFETVIRYLGGLLGAYDLSQHRYALLLSKAEELAEVLIGAFDTPNHMPIPFYYWAPSYASQPHRSSAHIVLAELGSLSLEFTRLAQLTGKQHYYDAVARVTDELEKWQTETMVPGLWPLRLDASGCKKPDQTNTKDIKPKTSKKPGAGEATSSTDDSVDVEAAAGLTPRGRPKSQPYSPSLRGRSPDTLGADDAAREVKKTETPEAEDKKSEKPGKPEESEKPEKPEKPDKSEKPDKPDKPDEPEKPPLDAIPSAVLEVVECEPQPLAEEPNAKSIKFGIGSQADSAYEYLPKMFALLGGRNSQYADMYNRAMDTVRAQLLFRPMIEDEKRDILFPATIEFTPKKGTTERQKGVLYDVTHLSCFAGGMFGLGAKVFGVDDDLEIAARLTDGCVWAYESMPVGIMAEAAAVVPCTTKGACAWNQTKWYDALDSQLEERLAAVAALNAKQEEMNEMIRQQSVDDGGVDADLVRQLKKDQSRFSDEEKRDVHVRKRDSTVAENEKPTKTIPGLDVEDVDNASPQGSFVPRIPLSHEKYVKARIQEERLPPGYTKIFDQRYGLRPEAIESVFYMYRITADDAWRKKGWAMFQAIQLATRIEMGNAALKDVTSTLMELDDTMESFWLAETLKYFYLLFSEPDLLSLDEYVLNTEAHPFKLP